MTQLAETIIDDGQALRATLNYLNETFNAIKGKEFRDYKLETYDEFIEFIKEDVCGIMSEHNFGLF